MVMHFLQVCIELMVLLKRIEIYFRTSRQSYSTILQKDGVINPTALYLARSTRLDQNVQSIV